MCRCCCKEWVNGREFVDTNPIGKESWVVGKEWVSWRWWRTVFFAPYAYGYQVFCFKSENGAVPPSSLPLMCYMVLLGNAIVCEVCEHFSDFIGFNARDDITRWYRALSFDPVCYRYACCRFDWDFELMLGSQVLTNAHECSLLRNVHECMSGVLLQFWEWCSIPSSLPVMCYMVVLGNVWSVCAVLRFHWVLTQEMIAWVISSLVIWSCMLPVPAAD